MSTTSSNVALSSLSDQELLKIKRIVSLETMIAEQKGKIDDYLKVIESANECISDRMSKMNDLQKLLEREQDLINRANVYSLKTWALENADDVDLAYKIEELKESIVCHKRDLLDYEVTIKSFRFTSKETSIKLYCANKLLELYQEEIQSVWSFFV